MSLFLPYEGNCSTFYLKAISIVKIAVLSYERTVLRLYCLMTVQSYDRTVLWPYSVTTVLSCNCTVLCILWPHHLTTVPAYDLPYHCKAPSLYACSQDQKLGFLVIYTILKLLNVRKCANVRSHIAHPIKVPHARTSHARSKMLFARTSHTC